MKLEIDLPLPAALLDRMAQTQQNPRYHGEGSVLAHTQYVVQECLQLRDAFDLSSEEREILYWTAVLHDVGKVRATVWMENRWRSPGHERASVPMAQQVLLDRPEVSAEARRRILDLIRWHGYPLRYSQYQQPLDDLKLLGTRVDLKLLGIFALMDFHGRDCHDKTDVIARMQEFQQQSVPQAEYEFARYDALQSLHQGWNLRHKNAAWNAIRLKDLRLLEKLIHAPLREDIATRGHRVTLVLGLPRAGKSTWVAAHHPEAFHVQLAEHEIQNALAQDRYALERKMIEFRHLMQVYLNRHGHVVLESLPLKDEVRLALLQALRDLNVTIHYVVLEAPMAQLQARHEADAATPSIESLEELLVLQDVLHPWEAHTLRYFPS